MLNLKRKLLFAVLVVMMVISIMPVYASVHVGDIDISLIVKYNGQKLTEGQELTLNPGDKIEVNVDIPYSEGVRITYYWNTPDIHVLAEGKTSATFTIPADAEPGSVNYLQMQAIVNNYTYNIHEVIDKFHYTIKIPDNKVDTTVDVNLVYNNSNVSTSEITEIPVGSELYIEGNLM